MKIIKEIRIEGEKLDPKNPQNPPWKYRAICTVRSDHYGSELGTFLEYFNIAKETYSELQVEDIRIVYYGGKKYKRTFGIEFRLPEGTGTVVPDGWKQVQHLEFTL